MLSLEMRVQYLHLAVSPVADTLRDAASKCPKRIYHIIRHACALLLGVLATRQPTDPHHSGEPKPYGLSSSDIRKIHAQVVGVCTCAGTRSHRKLENTRWDVENLDRAPVLVCKARTLKGAFRTLKVAQYQTKLPNNKLAGVAVGGSCWGCMLQISMTRATRMKEDLHRSNIPCKAYSRCSLATRP